MAFFISPSVALDLCSSIIIIVSQQPVELFADNKMSGVRFANKPLITPGLAAHLQTRSISCQSVANYVLLTLRASVVSLALSQRTCAACLHTLDIIPTNQGT